MFALLPCHRLNSAHFTGDLSDLDNFSGKRFVNSVKVYWHSTFNEAPTIKEVLLNIRKAQN